MGLIGHFLYLIDFFPLFPSLQITFQSKDSYSNKVSQVTSFLIMLISVLSVYYFGYNMFTRQKPQNVVSEYYQTYPEYLNITKENSFFCFGLRDDNLKSFIDESVYTVDVTVKMRSKNGTNKQVYVSVKSCEEQDIPETPSIQQYFKENPIFNQYCIADYGPIDLEGSQDNSYMKFFNIQIKTCQNSSFNNNSCKSLDLILDSLASSYFYLGFTTYAVDPLNYTFPFLQMGGFYSMPIDATLSGSTTINLQHIEIITDDGILFENADVQKGLAQLSDRTFYQTKSGNVVQETSVELDKVVKRYSRKYDKLQDVLAKTGGVMKIIMIVAFLLSRPLVRIGFYEDLCNDIFDYRMKFSQKTGIKFGFFQYIISLFNKKNPVLAEKRELLNRTKRILQENLNISNILKKLLELEKLKYILLSGDQLNLFQYIPKPLVQLPNNTVPSDNSFNNSNRHMKSSVWEDVFMKRALTGDDPPRAWEAYQELQSKEHKSKIDARLLKCFGFSGGVKKRMGIIGGESPVNLKKKRQVFKEIWRKIRRFLAKFC